MPISGEGRDFALVRCPDSESWLEQRRRGVGGSDVAAIMGLSPYATAYSVWCEKTGLAEPEDISEKPAVAWGNILEPVVGEHYASLHPDRRVRRVNAVCQSIARPWAQASLDYEVEDTELGWGVLEIKTAGLRRAQDWDEGVPLYYVTQTTQYLSVTGRPFADVAVLIGGQDYREFRIMRDEDDVKAVNDAVDSFWQHNVLGNVAPEITGAACDSGALLASTPQESDECPYEVACVETERFLEARMARDRAERRYKEAANILKAKIGENAGIETCEGRFTWQRGTSKRFNTQAFDRDFPGLRDKYMTTAARDGGIRFTPRKE